MPDIQQEMLQAALDALAEARKRELALQLQNDALRDEIRRYVAMKMDAKP